MSNNPRTFYYGSGSPYAWKVWLALEFKQLPYEFKLLSFDKGDTRAPEFLALNPRGKVPVLVDEGHALYESSAIVEYLEDRYPERPLLARDPLTRALARRISAEVDVYFNTATRPLALMVFGREKSTPESLAAAREGVVAELQRFSGYLGDREYFAGDLGLADFSFYPHYRLVQRFDLRLPDLRLADALPANLRAWQERLTALPYHDRTIPPHWKA
ncbi:glutathione S-transferase family protein [Nannocystis sp. ILAH1]|uniref:glutathione S-transferase family protein n=1 Tax=Nannocystis sp. ILAH1 TaxID=2996789 RepID=UPI00226ECF6E|nr:glutathione S-transferase family protein [Nannocystis sp. ILAH1]MCY0989095.1 glutathione S-transferase family protein [Nannocystis sp. ILAH1]